MSNLTLDVYDFLSHSTVNERNVSMSLEFKIDHKIVGNKYGFLIICKLNKPKLKGPRHVRKTTLGLIHHTDSQFSSAVS